MRSRLLRMNGNYITKRGFFSRKSFLCHETNGAFKTKRRDAPPPNPMQDPNMMQDMLKNNMTSTLPMMGMGGLINWVLVMYLCAVCDVHVLHRHVSCLSFFILYEVYKGFL